MRPTRPFVFLSCLLASIGLFFGTQPERGSRGLACVDGTVSPFPLPEQLFSEVQDEALRKSAQQYYLFLSMVEFQALSSQQEVRNAYGLSAPASSSLASLYAPAAIQNFDLSSKAAAPFSASGALWGSFPAARENPSAAGVASATGILGSLPSASPAFSLSPFGRYQGADLSFAGGTLAYRPAPAAPSNLLRMGMTIPAHRVP